MKVLLVFATNSGGTQMASQTVTDALKNHGHEVTIKEVRETTFNDFTSPDLIILASPTWDYEGLEGQPHPDYRPFMEGFKDKKLPGKKFAVFGLGDSSYTYFCGAVTHLEKFVRDLQGTLVVDSLKIDGYYLDQAKNTQTLTDWANNLAGKLS